VGAQCYAVRSRGTQWVEASSSNFAECGYYILYVTKCVFSTFLD
jgi:hypothetical protein